jgi:Tfp pilus assembly protein PilF
MRHRFSLLLASSLSVAALCPASAQTASEQQLGNVHFETSCNEVAQRRFDRAMRYQHSFWYSAAREIFNEVAAADAQCGMAYWGVALSYLDNPHSPIPQPNLAPGLAAIQKAKDVSAKTERERDYIDALSQMYVDYDKLTHQQRIQAYLEAMEKLAAKYPKDDEAQIFYAITLNTSASPMDKTYAQQKKGAAILEPIWKRQPQHPGIAHYLIHLYDYPSLAKDGIPAALLYAKIAPAAPHAQHMPSHIFTRVGYWKESIQSNSVSAAAAAKEKEPADELHASDYLVYADLQLGRDRDAEKTIEKMKTVTGLPPTAFGAHFALAASPARYVIERNDWAAAAKLDVRPSTIPHVQAITYFARALGAARSHQVDAAKADLAKLAELREQLRTQKNGYWANIVDIQWQVANAWILDAEGNTDAALRAMSAAADAEDKTEKSPVTPGPLAPARELYGEMLLAHGKSAEALAAFEATMAKEPNRLHGYFGAAEAAKAVGNKDLAKANYRKLVELTAGSDADRSEVRMAKGYLARN